MEKSPIYANIEKCFSDLKQNPKDKEPLQRIERSLKHKFGMEFSVTVVHNKTNEFFGMSVYPEVSMLDMLVAELIKDGNHHERESSVSKIWAEQNKWVIEIDDMILEDYNLNANPSEMTAVLIHEIGHVTYSNTVPVRALKAVRYQLTKLNYKAKQIIKWKRAQRLLDLVVIEACSSKSFSKYSKDELNADKFAFKQGYGDELCQFIDKMLKTYGNKDIDRSEHDIEQDINAIASWSMETISELEYRKNTLQRMLESVGLRTSSTYTRNILKGIRHDFFSQKSSINYTAAVGESVMNEWKKYSNDVVMEQGIEKCHKEHKSFKIKQTDIDMIDIQVQKITTLDDKLYVLDLISSMQDRLEQQNYLHKIKDTNMPLTSVDRIKEYTIQLNKLRQQTVKKQVIKSKTFFKNYPKGYDN